MKIKNKGNRTMKSMRWCIGILIVGLSLFVSCVDDANSLTGADNSGTVLVVPEGMKLIPAKDSTFSMGSNNGQSDEKPVHTVRFTYDFCMDSTEVTQKKYNAVMSDPTYGYVNYAAPDWRVSTGIGDNYPAYFVNWYDAALYCNALSKAAGKDTVYIYDKITGTPGNKCRLSNIKVSYNANGFRLPTEAEWEYAARARTITTFYWGSSLEGEYCWYYSNSGMTSHEVAGKKPNKFGLYDMSGNLFEICNDWFHEYNENEAVDPVGPDNGSYYISRGGGWNCQSSFLRSSYRGSHHSNLVSDDTGFRVVYR